MRLIPRGRPRSLGTLLALPILLAIATEARSNPMFSITDLGTGDIRPTTDANGNGVVFDSSGRTAYPFQPVAGSNGPAPSGFPLLYPAPDVYDFWAPNHNFGFAQIEQFSMKGGLGFAVEVSGVAGHLVYGEVYYAPKNPDGSWGSPVALWSGNPTMDGGRPFTDASILGVSDNNLVLGIAGNNSAMYPFNLLVLYNLKNKNSTDVYTDILSSSSKGIAGNGWWGSKPLAFDREGRILLAARDGYMGSIHTLLLTPDGVTSDPIPVPEPGSWAVFGLGAAAIAARRLGMRGRRAA